MPWACTVFKCKHNVKYILNRIETIKIIIVTVSHLSFLVWKFNQQDTDSVFESFHQLPLLANSYPYWRGKLGREIMTESSKLPRYERTEIQLLKRSSFISNLSLNWLMKWKITCSWREYSWVYYLIITSILWTNLGYSKLNRIMHKEMLSQN